MAEFDRQLKDRGATIYGGSRTRSRFRIDYTLLSLLLILMAIGLVVLYSASGQEIAYVKRQALFMFVGLLAMLAIAQLSPRLMERWAFVLYFGGLLLLVAVIFFGVGAKGAQRWLDLGFFRFQPSELLKIGVPMMLSSYLAKRLLPPRFKHVVAALLMTALPAILIGLQPDLGTALLIICAGGFVLFLAGLSKRYLLGGVVVMLISAPVFWTFFLHDYQKARIITLFDPQSDKLGAGWNIIQSTTAIGAGGLTGKGWLLGKQSQLDFLPEGHTDFIIAVLSEEFGFVGVLLLLSLYLLIIAKGIIVSLRAQSTFGRLLAGSLTVTFFVYVFANLGMVAGILPVVGIPLPMISYGGTAVVSLLLGFGMIMAIATEEKRMGEAT